MSPYFYAIISVLIVSLISLVGIFSISIKEDLIKKYISLFVSLAVGALLGDAFIHLIPESFATITNSLVASLLVICGILLFFIIEKFLHWHHHMEDLDEEIHHIKNPGKMILVSDGVHNLIDGLIIGTSYLVSLPVGIATTIAVILHEIPQEIGDFAVLLHSGYTRTRALWLNFLSALTALVGVIIALSLGNTVSNFIIWLVPIAAGGFIYIAMSDLVPELHKTKNTTENSLQLIMILAGVGMMILLIFLE